MHRFCQSAVVIGIGVLAGAAAPLGAKSSNAPAASPEDAQVLYSLGVLISRNLEEFQLSPAEFERVKSGLVDGFNNRARQVDLTADTPKIQALRRQRAALLAKQREEDGKALLTKAAALPDARKTARGAVLIPIHRGTGGGGSPGPTDQVTVNYQGKLVDGTVFDSSLQRGEPATFSLTGVIACWSEALPLMKVGDKSRIVCPPDLAYGARGEPPKIGPQSTLDFEVELLGLKPGAAAVSPSAGSSPSSPASEPSTR